MTEDNKGVGLIEIVLILTVIMLIIILAGGQNVGAQEMQKVKITCYCPESCPGTVTASGEKVREGILASSREHLGDCAMIYLTDGTFMGYFESLDVGGTEAIRRGDVIDVWTPNLEKAKDIMRRTSGEVHIEWIEKPQG